MNLPEKPYTTNLVAFETEDGVLLHGALFTPRLVEATETALLFLHGKTANFYSGPCGVLAPLFTQLGLSSFSINMRCHDLGYIRSELPSPNTSEHFFRMAGGAWEIIEEGHRDIQAAVTLLRDRGYQRIVLCGHSSGGFYAVDYAARFTDLAGIVLLSTLITNKMPFKLWFPGPKDLEVARRQAETMVSEGRGNDLLPLKTWYHAISANSLLDRVSEREGWFDNALAEIDKPTLWLHGSIEDRDPLWRRYYEDMATSRKQLSVIEGADHSYQGHERAVYDIMSNFIVEHVLNRTAL